MFQTGKQQLNTTLSIQSAKLSSPGFAKSVKSERKRGRKDEMKVGKRKGDSGGG